MKSAIEKIRELSEISNDYPTVVPLIGAVLELEEKVRALEQTKEDKPATGKNNISASPNDLTRGKLQAKLHQILTAAGDKEQEVAMKVHMFLSSLQ